MSTQHPGLLVEELFLDEANPEGAGTDVTDSFQIRTVRRSIIKLQDRGGASGGLSQLRERNVHAERYTARAASWRVRERASRAIPARFS